MTFCLCLWQQDGLELSATSCPVTVINLYNTWNSWNDSKDHIHLYFSRRRALHHFCPLDVALSMTLTVRMLQMVMVSLLWFESIFSRSSAHQYIEGTWHYCCTTSCMQFKLLSLSSLHISVCLFARRNNIIHVRLILCLLQPFGTFYARVIEYIQCCVVLSTCWMIARGGIIQLCDYTLCVLY